MAGDQKTEAHFIGNLGAFDALSDFDVVQRVRTGDAPLYELIMRRYNRRLFRIARSVVQDEALAQDVVQDAYILAYEHLDQFRGPTGFGAWLIQITLREAQRTRRKESNLVSVDNLDAVAGDTRDDPEPASIDLEAAHLLEQALDKLPRDFRVVFVMRELEELSVNDVAAALEIKPATVKTRLFRARALLRIRLRNRYDHSAGAFPFGGRHCDAIVRNVLRSIAQRSDTNN